MEAIPNSNNLKVVDSTCIFSWTAVQLRPSPQIKFTLTGVFCFHNFGCYFRQMWGKLEIIYISNILIRIIIKS